MQYNYYPQQPPMQPMGAPPPRRNRWVIPIVILVACALIAATVVIIVWANRSDKQAAPDANAPVAINIPGLLARQQPQQGTPYRYGDTALYNACSLVTLAELPGLGLESDLRTAVDTGTVRLYESRPDRNLAAEPNPEAGEASECQYLFASSGFVAVSVNQVPFNAESNIDGLLRKVAETYQENGFKVQIAEKDLNGTQAVITNSTIEVSITVSGKQNDQLGILKKTVALVSKKLTSPPEPVLKVEYTEEYQGIKDVCTLLTNDDFQQVTGVPGGSTVEYNFYLSKKTERYDGTEVTRIENECNRKEKPQSFDEEPRPSQPDVTLTTLSWPTDDMAKIAHDYYTNPNSSVNRQFGTPVALEVIGDGPAYITHAFTSTSLVFRKGKTHVALRIYDLEDPKELATRLIPIAKTVLARMR